MDTIESLRRIRGNIKTSFTALKTWLDKETKKSVLEAQLRKEHLAKRYNEFLDVNNKIIAIDSEESDDYYSEIEEQYLTLVARLEELSASQTQQAESLIDQSHHYDNYEVPNKPTPFHKFPRLPLPKFTGKAEDWPSFYQQFDNAIEPHGMTEVNKFQFLLSCLSGDAAELIKNIPITAANYDIALTILRRRYDNKRLNMRTYLQSLFQLSPVAENDEASLRSLLNTTSANIRALENLGYVREGLANELIAQLIVSKLDKKSRELWETRIAQQDLESNLDDNSSQLDDPSEYDIYAELVQFLEGRLRVITSVYTAASKKGNHDSISSSITSKNARVAKTVLVASAPASNTTERPSPTKTTNSSSFFTRVCPICAETHSLYQCETFRRLSIQERYEKVRTLKLCVNCFSKTHWAQNCSSTKCKLCGRLHHTLLHPASTPQTSTIATTPAPAAVPVILAPLTTSSPVATSTRPKTVLSAVCQHQVRDVLLATAIIDIRFGTNVVQVNALLDGGSHTTLITTNCQNQLRSSLVNISSNLSGLGGIPVQSSALTKFVARSRVGNFELHMTALVTDSITDPLPPEDFVIDATWSFVKDYTLADPKFNTRKEIDLLIGADFLYSILLPDIRHQSHAPTLLASQFGWLVTGPYTVSSNSSSRRLFCQLTTVEYDNLRRFWELEDLPSRNPTSKDHLQAENFFVETAQRIDGRFSVRLPFRNELRPSDSRQLALQRFHRLKITDQYSEFMNEYQQLGHMRRAAPIRSNCYYIPHHAVFRNGKIRVVFDASMKSPNGLSLNDCLLAGPTIQPTLFEILLKFRTHRFAFTTDVAKMYRQFLVREDDRCWQRILWVENGQIVDFELTTVTYGTSCAPFLAIRCLYQLADTVEETHPRVAEVIKTEEYVDDILSGADSLEEAAQLRDELIEVFSSARLQLSKWRATHTQLLPETPREPIKTISESGKTLGLEWDSVADHFVVSSAAAAQCTEMTKRTVLSQLHRIFDPLGLIAPITIAGKLLIQELWVKNVNWDDPVTDEFAHRFQIFLNSVQLAATLRFSRYLFTGKGTSMELHGFADASSKAYAACIYVRVRDADRTYSTLLCSKTRVAPTRTPRTIPELELCAASLLIETFQSVAPTLQCSFDQCYGYSDSAIVLWYLSRPPGVWKPFVANRTERILKCIPKDRWSHIPGDQNPADLATRARTFHNFSSQLPLWKHGPKFLVAPTLPTFPSVEEDESALAYLRKPRIFSVITRSVREVDVNASFPIFGRISSYSRLQSAWVYVIRFITILRMRKRTANQLTAATPPSAAELETAELALCMVAQKQVFAEEFRNLAANQPLPARSALRSLAPIFDNGVIRVGGRLDNANLPFAQRHPIILTVQHQLTKLILRDTHRNFHHAGVRFCTAMLQRRFFFLGNLTQALQKCIRTCGRCVRLVAPAQLPPMGDLPNVRVEPIGPFVNVGVDLAGPILTKPNIRSRSSTRIKTYVAVFVCMSSKAVHLEAVSDLSTASFLASFHRFTGRRGFPQTVYSDNGTNFVGASAEVNRRFTELLQDESFAHYAAHHRFTWSFIPPAAPHMGGLWEAAVKAMKFHLLRVIGTQVLTFEELTTILCQIEAILNSRPLVPLIAKEMVDALTPGHLLIGRPLVALPEPDCGLQHIPTSQRWRLVSQMRRSFWTRWCDEYLVTLHRRNKWQAAAKPFAINDIVLIRDENTPPLSWPLAIVTDVYPGKDGHIRVVEVRTRNSTTLRRPVTKLVLLPVQEEPIFELPEEASSTAAGC